MNKTSIYLVDDHKILRESLVILLKQEENLEVIGEAADGQDAYKEILCLNPDIAILDITIPQLNGLDLAAKLKQDRPDIKIIILTMHKSEDFVSKAYSKGVNGYVLKENALEELLHCIRIVSEGKTYIPEDLANIIIKGFVSNHLKEENIDSNMISSREREIVQLLAEGYNNKEIASMLNLSIKTVETHRANIMKKMGFKNITDLVLYAVRNKLVQP